MSDAQARGGLELLGVVEGFYGRPWSEGQRRRLFGWMAGWGMDTFLYAPKDDLKHRARWREPYDADKSAALAGLAESAEAAGLRFVYALAPGLDVRWDEPADQAALLGKLGAVAEFGVRHFALLFDDIPYAPDRGAQAAVQVEATHAALGFLRARGISGLFLFCPTEYCGRRAKPTVAGSPYLRVLGGLAPEIHVLWTGPEVISHDIGAESIREVAAALGRRPVLWDNLHANDYAPRRVHLGPYAGRPPELRHELAGVLSNPNTPFEPNFPGLASLADWARGGEGWTPAASLERALASWLPHVGADPAAPVGKADLALLADALHLPHRLGPRAERLLGAARALAERRDDAEAAVALEEGRFAFRRVLEALERGGNRDLLYDLHPHLIELIDGLARLLSDLGRPGYAEVEDVPPLGGLADRLALARGRLGTGRPENGGG